MPNIEFTILKDTREQNGYFFDQYASKGIVCLGMVDKKLDTGDYSILGLENKICIERKASVSEIAINLGTDRRRFMAEIKRMQSFEHKYLILEFSMRELMMFPDGSGIPMSKRKYIRTSGQFLLKQLLSIQVDYGIHILFCADKAHAQITVSSLLRKLASTGVEDEEE